MDNQEKFFEYSRNKVFGGRMIAGNTAFQWGYREFQSKCSDLELQNKLIFNITGVATVKQPVVYCRSFL
jgi:hypothetical protein